MTKKKPTDLQYLQNILIEKEALVQEMRTRVDKLQEQLTAEIMRAAKWEARFDRLLRAASGESADAPKWGEAATKMKSWTT